MRDLRAAAEHFQRISADKGIELAQQELARVKNLVDAGALPRVRIDEAEANLDDAKDEVILAHDLYGDLPEKGASEEASAEMIAAAQRRVDRQQARLDEAQKDGGRRGGRAILSGAL